MALAFSARRAWTGRPPLPPRVTGGTLLHIVITGLVHHVLLANAAAAFSMTGSASGAHAVADRLLHTVTPIATALDWLLLTHPGGLRPREAARWLLYPLAYLLFALTRGAPLTPGAPARYPYPFLDVDSHGYGGALGKAAMPGLAFFGPALTIVAPDRIRPYLRGPKTGFRLRARVG
ncbi:Pr6Pr family membrane protein [Streptomyces sp. NPDC006368]|uniref:Pr6Pr family membrane protein n=1 Tax=Streptomyces sp. NPDC006368 TaxID=3156760 RepID=UPI0033B45C08